VTELALPLELEGAWEHALIVSYGADLPFFERILARQLPVACRNRVILADRRQYLEACIRYAEGGQVRTLNQHYVVDGVAARHAMHAKLILLASPARGRLLVGSGNLGFEGYASGGEIFTRYTYEPEATGHLAAFVSARQFLERLIERGALGAVATQRIEYLFENAPWLYQATDNTSPLWHNLDESFLDQIVRELDGADVDELVVAAPFYDAEARALSELIRRTRPHRVRLLVQPERTSVNPTAIDRVAGQFPGQFEIVPIQRPDDPYIHAKLILATVGERTLCLQGSPNLSQVALLRSGEEANFELANAFVGARGGFDGLLAALEFGPPAASASVLALSYEPLEAEPPEVLAGWHLTRGEWERNELVLHFRGDPPDLDEVGLLVGEHRFQLDVLGRSDEALRLDLQKEAQELLERSLPVVLIWREGDDEARSNPIFPHNIAALERALEATTSSDRLAWVGSLDGLDDDELERLLQELADAVVVDQDSLWRLAGREPRAHAEDEEVFLAYEDVDYEALREHPKLRQYLAGFGSGGGGQRSRIQLILSSIAASFRPEHSEAAAPRQTLTALDEADAETEEELEEQAEERERRRATLEGHLRRVFQNFIRRYLRGATTPEFEERVGFEVMTQNYLIFSFILLRLFRKPWMPTRFLVEAMLETQERFLGTRDGDGVLQRLTPDQRERSLAWLREQHADGLLLAGTFLAASVTRAEEHEAVRLELRDAWRAQLHTLPVALGSEALSDAVHVLSGPVAGSSVRRSAVVSELRALANFETESSFLASLGAGAAWFDQVSVMRPALKRQTVVKCLYLSVPPAEGERGVREILGRWMQFADIDFYRIQVEDPKVICFYDRTAGEGVYWDGSEPHDFTEQPVATSRWDTALDRLFAGEPRNVEPLERVTQRSLGA
jgi:hypothetical protein